MKLHEYQSKALFAKHGVSIPKGQVASTATDARAIAQELVSVTPLDLDLTHDGILANLPDWQLPAFEAVVEADLEASAP